MTYQQNSGVHRLNEFVPTYVPHSDYLPNRVVDVHQSEAQQWVNISLFSCQTINNKKNWAKSTHKNPLSSTPTDTFLSAHTKM